MTAIVIIVILNIFICKTFIKLDRGRRDLQREGGGGKDKIALDLKLKE